MFFVPVEARWNIIQSKAKLPTIGVEVDSVMKNPPDLAKMEADRVLEQSELLASELSK